MCGVTAALFRMLYRYCECSMCISTNAIRITHPVSFKVYVPCPQNLTTSTIRFERPHGVGEWLSAHGSVAPLLQQSSPRDSRPSDMVQATILHEVTPLLHYLRDVRERNDPRSHCV